MKVLLVSYWFPPTNAMGAVRAGKLAKFLLAAGHDLRVLAGPSLEPLLLPLEMPLDRVFRPGVAVPAERPVTSGQGTRAARAFAAPLKDAIRPHYYAMRFIPDRQASWLQPAIALGRAAMAAWRPDVILASAPPFTGLIATRRLSREFAIPWVAEFRDSWADDPYSTDPWWRRRLDRLFERLVLRSAAGLVAVSPVVARTLRERYVQPVRTILNGFAEEDIPPVRPRARSASLSIIYTGSIYVGYRDPTPLFAAIARLGERRHLVTASFYGPAEHEILPLAARQGIA
ncbi:MAG: glycosyltransferase, partial [Pseudomonadota bacterium]|nr:glycosyltransferase [Pseudomonadota bacterium]